MSLLVFQNSRRQLLEILMDEVRKASAHRQDHLSRNEAEGTDEKRRIDNLLKAVSASDQEVKRLEYWSDIRKMVREGEATGPIDHDSSWPAQQWQGLETSGPAANDATVAQRSDLSGNVLDDEQHEGQASLHPAAAASPEKTDVYDDSTDAFNSDAYMTAEETTQRMDKGKGRAT